MQGRCCRSSKFVSVKERADQSMSYDSYGTNASELNGKAFATSLLRLINRLKEGAMSLPVCA